jgi:NAD(P)-dependent dehydrogenase (short-subunit alcohol dehydrogenase family)
MKKDVSIITGGCGGLGFATATILGQQGPLVLCDVSEEKLKAKCAELYSIGIDAYPMAVDITRPKSVKEIFEKAQEMGNIKNLICTAGVSPFQMKESRSGNDVDLIIDVNAIGTINMVEAAFPLLVEGSAVVLTSSSAAYLVAPSDTLNKLFSSCAEPDFADRLKAFIKGDNEYDNPGGKNAKAYSIAKAFVIYYMKMNVWRFGEKSINIASVAPGMFATPMHWALEEKMPTRREQFINAIPLHRNGYPWEFGKLVGYLCSKSGAYLAGIDILIDNGYFAAQTVPQLPSGR